MHNPTKRASLMKPTTSPKTYRVKSFGFQVSGLTANPVRQALSFSHSK